MSGYRFLILFKRFLLYLLLGLFCAVSWQAYMLVSDARETLKFGRQRMAEISQEAQESLVQWRTYTVEMRAQLDNKKTQESIGLLLRSGNDINLGIKKFNGVLDELKAAIKETSGSLNEKAIPRFIEEVTRISDHINLETLPEIDTAIQQTTRTIGDIGTAAQAISLDAHLTLRESRLAIEELKFRVKDPRWDSIIGNTDTTMKNVAETTAYTKDKMRQIAQPVGWIWRGIKGAVSVGLKAIIY